MNQMTVEVVQIVGLGRSCISWSILAEIAKNMRCMMIDNDDHSARLNESAGGRYQPRLFKQFSDRDTSSTPSSGLCGRLKTSRCVPTKKANPSPPSCEPGLNDQ